MGVILREEHRASTRARQGIGFARIDPGSRLRRGGQGMRERPLPMDAAARTGSKKRPSSIAYPAVGNGRSTGLNLVAAVLFGDVIGKFDVLQIHAAQNGMNRTQNGTHNLVNNSWVNF